MARFRINPNSGAKGFIVTAKNKQAAALKGSAKRKATKGYARGFTVQKVN